jgi:2-(1,2-epoxy-1,2-dihydrophenyl)acetyl-CoA isomerase
LNLDGWTGLQLTRPRPGVLLVVLDRPDRLNTLTAGMKRDLVELCTHIQADDETRTVVVTGAGKAFCAGDLLGDKYRTESPGSVPALPGGHQDAESTYVSLRAFSHALNRAVRSLDKITIAAINGAAIQSGLSLALACDFRIASQAARLGSGTLRFGLMPDEGGHWLVLQHMGIAAAIDFLLRARIVDARDALARGLVNEVVPDEQLTSAALDLAEELARGPQLALRMLKRALYCSADEGFERALDDIGLRTSITDHHPDALEGAMAFLEKRSPRFS